MPAAEIDEEMVRFAAGDGDILLATNIIEAGLDIPRANTMIIWRADRFGLAQLHQLRGRVGRGRARGYLMLVTEPDAEIAPATLKRLRTMEALDQLGAGFAISARDLDLRGAGELLGEEQAGHMKLIGLGLYQHLLGQALRVARGEIVEDWLPELHLGMSGRLPESWIPEEEDQPLRPPCTSVLGCRARQLRRGTGGPVRQLPGRNRQADRNRQNSSACKNGEDRPH
jgi:transcription-repair coupling factor (superfamily II helicase)